MFEIILTGENRSNGRETCSMQLCPPQIVHRLVVEWNRPWEGAWTAEMNNKAITHYSCGEGVYK